MSTHYPVMTSQDAFTPMKGHVVNNARVRMNSGDMLILISSTAKGYVWDIYKNDYKEIVYRASSAFDVEQFIVNY